MRIKCKWAAPQTAPKKILAILVGSVSTGFCSALVGYAWMHRPASLRNKAWISNKTKEKMSHSVDHLFLWAIASACGYAAYETWKTMGEAKNFCRSSMRGVIAVFCTGVSLTSLYISKCHYQKRY